MNEKLKAALIIILIVAAIAIPVSAVAYWVYSKSVQHEVTEYDLQLTDSWNGRLGTLTATLKNPAGQPVEGATIQFGTGTSEADWDYLNSAVTDASGIATYVTKDLTVGTYNFIARFSVTQTES